MSIIRDSALVAIDGTVVVIVMVVAGIIATRYEILNKAAGEMIGKLILNILLPCLLFTEMMDTFNIADIDQFALLFFFCTCMGYLVHIVVGCGIGWIVGKLLGSERDIRRLIMATIGFQDTTAIPLVFASILGKDSTTDKDKDFTAKATSCVLIYTVFVTVYKWTIAYGLMKPLHVQSYETKLNSSNYSTDSRETPKENDSSLWWKIKKIMNPPIYATLISIPLAMIPGVKKYIFTGSGAVFTDNVYHALGVLGGTVSPMINILLGCNLSQGYPPSATIKWSEIISIIIGKEVIMPSIGLGIIGGFYSAGILQRVTALMLMVIYAGPTSLQLLMICTNHKNQVDNISKLYLIMYATAAIPMMLWTMGFLVILYD